MAIKKKLIKHLEKSLKSDLVSYIPILIHFKNYEAKVTNTYLANFKKKCAVIYLKVTKLISSWIV